MTTYQHAPSARQTPRAAALRRLVTVGAIAPLLAVAACSGDDPITASRQAASEGSTAVAATTTTVTPTTETTSAAPAKPTETALKIQLKDPELGHVVKPLRLVRNVPWPAGNPVSEASYEIVALELQVTAGSRYSADVEPTMFTLGTGGTAYVPATKEFDDLKGAPLVEADRAKTVKGWLYFKVARGEGQKLVLAFHRPAYKVSTTDKLLPAKVLRAALS